MSLIETAKRAQEASNKLAGVSSQIKKKALLAMSDAIEKNSGKILAENKKDLDSAKGKLNEALLDRLKVTEKTIREMALGLRQIAGMEDPVGEIIEEKSMPNGLAVKKVRVPLGVVLVIYESRPNVTVDTAGLALKAGNAVILKGGSDAINSNKMLAKIISDAACSAGIPENSITFIDSTDRKSVDALLTMNRYIDVVIPRGSNKLIQYIVENSTVPVIETGEGNCHLYIDEDADRAIIEPIVINAKTQRPGTCNSIEKLLVHKKIAKEVLPGIVRALRKHNVEVIGDEQARKIDSSLIPATEKDWDTEYLDLKIAVKVVDNVDDAISHINEHNTRHSESILSKNAENVAKFMNQVNAAAVYANASTRFTDGFQLGMGAEIGISTQKLHARGPMGIKELTTYKLEVFGKGQVRQ